ncbi:MAG TPA: ABC transporter permease [Candidatus Saccharimonadales bacterium]|nr:ABC transporter permease [Candidatus Saccharimonadales bacterium]
MSGEVLGLAQERQEGGARAFLRACWASGWLQYRNLRYYPISLVLAGVQELTTVGVWYFVARFLHSAADASVAQYGGNYLAFVVLGVLLNQVALAALTGPFQTISDAFWDKRLETYRLSIHGIWANVVGRLAWDVVFAAVLQFGALALLIGVGAIQLHAGLHVELALVAFLLLIGANAGLGIAGASLFFLLEVKNGSDPITWAYKYLVMLAAGLYVPVTLLPVWLRVMGAVLPQTYAFAAERTIVLTGAGWSQGSVSHDLVGLAIGTLVALSVGFAMLNLALRRAEQRGGIGVVV